MTETFFRQLAAIFRRLASPTIRCVLEEGAKLPDDAIARIATLGRGTCHELGGARIEVDE